MKIIRTTSAGTLFTPNAVVSFNRSDTFVLCAVPVLVARYRQVGARYANCHLKVAKVSTTRFMQRIKLAAVHSSC